MATVEGSWRLKTIILIIVLLTSLYVVNGFFYNIEVDEYGYATELPNENLSYNQTEIGTSEGQNFIDVLFQVGDYLTFGNINNIYARIVINLFTSICWLVIGYIVYTFIRDWVPFI